MELSSIQTYILFNIYSKKWKYSYKLPSIGQLAIKFHQSETSVKRKLNHLKGHNLLQCQKRIGCFVNSHIFDFIPLSMREKYGLKLLKTEFSQKQNFYIKNYYVDAEQKNKCWSEIIMPQNIFIKEPYLKSRNFLENLAINGIIITNFEIESKIIIIENKPYCLEICQFYNQKQQLIAKSKQYIPNSIWKDLKKISI